MMNGKALKCQNKENLIMAGTGKNLVFASRASGSSHDGDPTYVEALVNIDNGVLPGTALRRNANGEFTLKDGSLAASDGIFYIADINAVKQGNMTDAWANGETGVALQPRVAQKFNMRAATGQTISVGVSLGINADGRIIAATVGTNKVYAYADETITTTANDQLVRVVIAAEGA